MIEQCIILRGTAQEYTIFNKLNRENFQKKK